MFEASRISVPITIIISMFFSFLFSLSLSFTCVAEAPLSIGFRLENPLVIYIYINACIYEFIFGYV